jgi:hypothetical protein
MDQGCLVVLATQGARMTTQSTDIAKGDTIVLPDGLRYYVHDVKLMMCIQLAGVSGAELMLTEVTDDFERVDERSG